MTRADARTDMRAVDLLAAGTREKAVSHPRLAELIDGAKAGLALQDTMLADIRRAVADARAALEALEFARDQAAEYALGTTPDPLEGHPDEQEAPQDHDPRHQSPGHPGRAQGADGRAGQDLDRGRRRPR